MVIIVPVSLGMIEGLSRKVGANPSGTILPSAKCERRESDTFPLGAHPGCYNTTPLPCTFIAGGQTPPPTMTLT